MKYIIIEEQIGDIKRETPIIFPDHLVHSDVVKHILPIMQGINCKVVSAGTIDFGSIIVSGRSETLNINSRGYLDELLIDTYNYFHGIVK